MTPEFWDELNKFKAEYSTTMTQAITNLCRKQLTEIAKTRYEINQKKKEEETIKSQPSWQSKKNVPPKEIVVENDGDRKIVKNEFIDE